MCDESYILMFNGDKLWYKNGTKPLDFIFHRTNGPAIEFLDGSKEWYINGKLHREDGPAVEWADGYNKWFLNGKKYSEKEYNRLIKLKVFV